MYDIDLTNVKKGKKIYLIFLGLGLLLLIIFAAIMYFNHKKISRMDASVTSSRVEVDSSIDDEGDTLYSASYYFKIDGREYVCHSRIKSSHYPNTDNKTVYYETKDPTNCLSESDKSGNKWFYLFLLLPTVFIVISGIYLAKTNKHINDIMYLNTNGKLVKGLTYRLEDSGIVINRVKIQKLVVDYKLPSGETLTLASDPRFDKKIDDNDGLVDLIIDENNPNNYFIDFNINRLSGNLDTDYYNKEN